MLANNAPRKQSCGACVWRCRGRCSSEGVAAHSREPRPLLPRTITPAPRLELQPSPDSDASGSTTSTSHHYAAGAPRARSRRRRSCARNASTCARRRASNASATSSRCRSRHRRVAPLWHSAHHDANPSRTRGFARNSGTELRRLLRLTALPARFPRGTACFLVPSRRSGWADYRGRGDVTTRVAASPAPRTRSRRSATCTLRRLPATFTRKSRPRGSRNAAKRGRRSSSRRAGSPAK
jgi:hypothetical protein